MQCYITFFSDFCINKALKKEDFIWYEHKDITMVTLPIQFSRTRIKSVVRKSFCLLNL